METTDIEEITPEPQPAQLILGSDAQLYLREAGKWAFFLAIVGFVFSALMLAGSLSFVNYVRNAIMDSSGPMATVASGLGGLVIAIYIALDIIYVFISVYLLQFGSLVKKGIVFSDNAAVTKAMDKLRSFFKIWGILTIVTLTLIAIGFIVNLVVRAGSESILHNQG